MDTAAHTVLTERHRPALETFIALKVILLATGAGLAIALGPFHDADSWQAVLTGMVLVGAMALQNAFHRVHLGNAPPSTIMTGTTTQVMIDLADRIYEPKGVESPSSSRLVHMSTTVLLFAIGCGAAALLYSLFGMKCFVAPPIVGSMQLIVLLIAWLKSPRDNDSVVGGEGGSTQGESPAPARSSQLSGGRGAPG